MLESLRTFVDDLLAVVEDEKTVGFRQSIGKHLQPRTTRGVVQTHRLGDCVGDPAPIAYCGQVDEPDSLGAPRQLFRPDGNCQPCLAYPSRPDQRDRTLLLE